MYVAMKLNPETWGKLRAREVKIVEYVNSSTTKSLEKMIYDVSENITHYIGFLGD